MTYYYTTLYSIHRYPPHTIPLPSYLPRLRTERGGGWNVPLRLPRAKSDQTQSYEETAIDTRIPIGHDILLYAVWYTYIHILHRRK